LFNKIIATLFFIGALGYTVTFYRFVTGAHVSDFAIGSSIFLAILTGVILGLESLSQGK